MKALDYSCSYCKCADLKLVDDQRGILKCPNCGYEMFEDEAESTRPMHSRKDLSGESVHTPQGDMFVRYFVWTNEYGTLSIRRVRALPAVIESMEAQGVKMHVHRMDAEAEIERRSKAK